MYIRPRIIPVLLMDERDLIKTVKFQERTYLGDPVNAVKIFNRKRIDELAVLDIGASRKNRQPDFEILQDIASEAFMPLSYGGGITSVGQARELAKIGYEKVIVNTELVRDPGLVRNIVGTLGGQSVVASIDAKLADGKYFCAINDGQEIVETSPVKLAREAEKLGCGEIFINSIDRDGMMEGYDLGLIKSIVHEVTVPVTACGGAGGIDDLRRCLHEGRAHAAAGGSMFVFYGKLRAVLITMPAEQELINAGVYEDE